MDNSVLYGLRNPAFTDDIRMSMFDRQFPLFIDEITGTPATDLYNHKINNGNPPKDEFDNRNKKSKKVPTWAKVLLGGAVVAAGVFACCKIKPVANFFKNIYTKIKSKFNSP